MFKWLRNFFSKALRAFKVFLKEVYTRIKMLLMAELLDFAKVVVKDIAKDPTMITDDDKRKEAFDRIKAEAIERGSKIKDHVINQLIEDVVGWLKIKGEF